MIYTVTLNPTLDRTMTIEHFCVGGTFKASHSEVLPAGKGVNVAHVIATLGEPVVALGVVGEQDAALFAAALAEARIENGLVPVPGTTRSSITVIDPALDTETHLRERGSVPPAGTVARVEEKLQGTSEGDWVVISGSLPPGMPRDTYRTLVRVCTRRGAHTILDANGPALLVGVEAPPTVLKPNLFELWQVDEQRPDVTTEREQGDVCVDEVLAAAQRVQERGVETVVVSLGARGVLGIDVNGRAWRASMVLDQPVVSTVGSGDALVAGLVVSLAQGEGLPEALRLGVACGAANTLVAGAGRCRAGDIERLAARADVCMV